MERPAVTCYKDVLKLCPFALDAAQSLMALGTKPKEVQELTLEATEGRHPEGITFVYFNLTALSTVKILKLFVVCLRCGSIVLLHSTTLSIAISSF